MATETSTQDDCCCGNVAIAVNNGTVNYGNGATGIDGSGEADSPSPSANNPPGDGADMGDNPLDGYGGDGTAGGAAGVSSDNGAITNFVLRCENGTVVGTWNSNAAQFTVSRGETSIGVISGQSFSDTPPSTGTYTYTVAILGYSGYETAVKNTINMEAACANGLESDDKSLSDLVIECVDGATGTFNVSWSDTNASRTYFVKVDGATKKTTSQTTVQLTGYTSPPNKISISTSDGQSLSGWWDDSVVCPDDSTPDTEDTGVCGNIQEFSLTDPIVEVVTNGYTYSEGLWVTGEFDFGQSPLPSYPCAKRIFHTDDVEYASGKWSTIQPGWVIEPVGSSTVFRITFQWFGKPSTFSRNATKTVTKVEIGYRDAEYPPVEEPAT